MIQFLSGRAQGSLTRPSVVLCILKSECLSNRWESDLECGEGMADRARRRPLWHPAAKPKLLSMTGFRFWGSLNWSIKNSDFLKLYGANSQNCSLEMTVKLSTALKHKACGWIEQIWDTLRGLQCHHYFLLSSSPKSTLGLLRQVVGGRKMRVSPPWPEILTPHSLIAGSMFMKWINEWVNG